MSTISSDSKIVVPKFSFAIVIIAFATFYACIGFIFLSGPSNKGDNNLKVKTPIFSPTLFSFLSPIKKDGLNITKLAHFNFFNSSSTKPLNFT